jgi:Importin, protein involved in nuclear import
MEQYLLGALDSNHKIREESFQHLKALEKNPGYANNLIELYHQGNEYLQLICLLVLKASISRN